MVLYQRPLLLLLMVNGHISATSGGRRVTGKQDLSMLNLKVPVTAKLFQEKLSLEKMTRALVHHRLAASIPCSFPAYWKDSLGFQTRLHHWRTPQPHIAPSACRGTRGVSVSRYKICVHVLVTKGFKITGLPH